MPLRVIQAFGGYSTGDEITDADEIAAITGSEQAGFVVATPDAPPKPVSPPPVAAPKE